MKFIQAHPSNFASPRGHAIDRIVVHYTGNNGDTAEANAHYFQNPLKKPASAHYFVDTREVVQSVKEGDRAFHAEDRTMNDRSIGVEMCSMKDAAGAFYIPCATITRTVALVKELMAKYGISVAGVLRHYDVSGKRCPEPFVRQPQQWEDFKAALTKEDAKMDEKNAPSAWAKEACQWAVARGLFVGDGKGNYHWQDAITREQMAAVLFRLHGKE